MRTLHENLDARRKELGLTIANVHTKIVLKDVNVSAEQFEALANASSIDFKVCIDEYNFTQKGIDGLRAVIKTSN